MDPPSPSASRAATTPRCRTGAPPSSAADIMYALRCPRRSFRGTTSSARSPTVRQLLLRQASRTRRSPTARARPRSPATPPSSDFFDMTTAPAQQPKRKRSATPETPSAAQEEYPRADAPDARAQRPRGELPVPDDEMDNFADEIFGEPLLRRERRDEPREQRWDNPQQPHYIGTTSITTRPSIATTTTRVTDCLRHDERCGADGCIRRERCRPTGGAHGPAATDPHSVPLHGGRPGSVRVPPAGRGRVSARTRSR